VTDQKTDQKYNVLLITNCSAAGGGAEQQLASLVAGVDKKKFNITVISLYAGGSLPQPVSGSQFMCMNRSGKYDFLPLWRMTKILRQRRIDLIQPFLSPATLFGIIPAFIVRTPVKVITERCGVRNKPGLGYKAYCKIEDLFGRNAQVAVANSGAGRDMLLERGYKEEKTMVIYNGLDTRRLSVDPGNVDRIRKEHNIKTGRPVVGIAAWMIPAKDHAGFIKSARIIVDKRPNTYFLILGGGYLMPELKVLVNYLNLNENVIFLGTQSHVGDYLSLFDIGVLSSVDHEGCSNSILEYMYLGKPVVATDVGGNHELVKPGVNGYLVPPKNPEALAASILSLIENPEKARAMGEKGRAITLERFSQQRMVADYQALWLDLMGKTKRRISTCQESAS
jgi:glycosyltransferase involved in cell wall biosynthesis